MPKPTAQYGIIGFPLGHTLSPVMHNTAFKEFKVDAIYKPFPLREEELEKFFADLRKKNSPIFGLNVTIPYKELVREFLDTLSPFAEKVNAVNTIEITSDRKFVGHNTDGPGFLSHFKELGVDIENKRIAILGAGGSSRAILASLVLIPEGPRSIKIYNRTTSRLEALIKDLGKRINVDIVEPVASIEDLNIELADILINTTSIGLNTDDIPFVDESMLHADLFVYDLIYNPKETPLLRMAKKSGAQVSNGLGMLYYQGVLAFEHWANMQISDKIKKKMRESLEEAL